MINNIYITAKINYIIKNETNNTLIQLFRYVFVGGFAFIIDFGALIIMTQIFKSHYLVSACVSFILGLIVNYFLSIKWVFLNRIIENQLYEFLLFTLVGLVGLGLNELFMWILTDVLMIFYVFSKLICTTIVCFWNFYARKIILC